VRQAAEEDAVGGELRGAELGVSFHEEPVGVERHLEEVGQFLVPVGMTAVAKVSRSASSSSGRPRMWSMTLTRSLPFSTFTAGF